MKTEIKKTIETIATLTDSEDCELAVLTTDHVKTDQPFVLTINDVDGISEVEILAINKMITFAVKEYKKGVK